MSVVLDNIGPRLVTVERLVDLQPQIVTLLILVGLAAVLLRPRKYGEIDIVGDKSDLRAALREGSKLYPSSAFAIPTSPPLVILPLAMMDEVKSLPDSKVSTAPELFKRAGGHYSKLGTNAAAAIKALRIDLKRRTTTVPDLVEETGYAFGQALGAYPEWAPLAVFPTMNRAVAVISGRVFLGRKLSRQEDWIRLSSDWAVRVFDMMRALQRYPAWLRPYITPHLAETKQVLAHRAQAKAFLAPTFVRHLEARAKGGAAAGTGEDEDEEDESLASWIMKYIAPRHATVEGLTRHQMSFAWASIHTSTHALTHILFDLATRPEYQDILRDEIDAVLPAGATDAITQADLPKLAKMDSFMKEAMRLHPITIVAPLRMVTGAPLTLSSGQTLAPGVSFGFDSTSINQSEALYRAPGPAAFDGLRFYRLRQQPGEAQKHQFGATGVQETFDFGHGIHACPGRHFAAMEIKIALVYLLTSYEFKIKDGHSRPADSLDEIWWIPDPTAEILIKSRQADQAGMGARTRGVQA